jgi:hypothetical protein
MPLESSIVKSIMAALKKLGCDVEKTHGSQYGMGGRADIYCLLPIPGRFPVPIYLEVKQPGKESSDLQKAWAEKKRRVLALVVEVHSVEEALEVVTSVQRGMREN